MRQLRGGRKFVALINHRKWPERLGTGGSAGKVPMFSELTLPTGVAVTWPNVAAINSTENSNSAAMCANRLP